MVLTEAFAAGTPVLASNIAGYADVVTDGDDGVLVPPADPQRLAEELQALSLDPQRLARMGERGARVGPALRLAAGRRARSRRVYERAVAAPAPGAPRPSGLDAPGRARARRRRRSASPPGGCRRSTRRPRGAGGGHRTARRVALGVAGALGVGLTFIAAQRIGVDQVVDEHRALRRRAGCWSRPALMIASMFLRASSWYSIARAALPRRPAAPPRRRLGDDGRGADVGDAAGPPRRAGARDGARPAHRPDARDVPGAARAPWSRRRVLNIVALVLLGVIIVASTDLFHSSSERLFLFSFAPLLLLVAVAARADRWSARAAPAGSRASIARDPRRAAQGAHAGSSSSAIRAAARSPRSPSSAPGRSSCSPATRCSRRSGSTTSRDRDRRRRGGPVRGQRHRGRSRRRRRTSASSSSRRSAS